MTSDVALLHEADDNSNLFVWQCDVANAAWVEGWIRHTHKNDPVTVEVRIDGKTYWSGLARRFVTIPDGDLPAQIGFLVDLPSFTSGSIVEVYAEGHCLKQVKVDPAERYKGNIDNIERSFNEMRVSGWTVDLLNVDQSNQLEICVGREKSFVTADLFREDLHKVGYGSGYHGFDLKISCRIEETVSIYALPGRVLLATSAGELPLRSENPEQEALEGLTETAVEGALDHFGSGSLIGWALAPDRLNKGLELDLLVNNMLYASVRADAYRSDLKAVFGSGYHGFRIDLPWPLPPNLAHKIEVVPQGSAHFSTPLVRQITSAPRSIGADADFRATANLLNMGDGQQSSEDLHVPPVTIAVVYRDIEALNACLTHLRAQPLNSEVEYLPILLGGQVCPTLATAFNIAVRAAQHELILVLEASVLPDIQALRSIALLRNGNIVAIGATETYVAELGDISPRYGELARHVAPSHEQRAQPRATRMLSHLLQTLGEVWDVPCTAAGFLAFRKKDALQNNGFNEAYDTDTFLMDFCLRLRASSGGKVVNAGGHFWRRRPRTNGFEARQIDDLTLFQKDFGYALARARQRDAFSRPGFWTTGAQRVVFAVSEISETTAAGDYYTARELGDQLAAQSGCIVSYIDQASNWYDLRGADILIVMRHDYDLTQLSNHAPDIFVIGWLRNWIDGWNLSKLDLVWASSKVTAEHIARSLTVPVQLVPIATNAETFGRAEPNEQLITDYCFIGNYWGRARDIATSLDPNALPFSFALYGSGWENVPRLAPFCRGFLPYENLPGFYASCRIVIDDANHVTKPWGSVNSRVFDALASGALVITNGIVGSQELFDGKLPTYSTRQELEDLIWQYLSDEPARQSKVKELRAIVLARHTYYHRAEVALIGLKAALAAYRIVIKISAPTLNDLEWGDIHFAQALGRALATNGASVRICARDCWDSATAHRADVVIVLLGLDIPVLRPDQLNIAWLISHPDKAAAGALNAYDHVFVASASYTSTLQAQLSTSCSTLLQCCDANIFASSMQADQLADGEQSAHPSSSAQHIETNALFVGNSRNEFRAIVKDALAIGESVNIVGSGWAPYIQHNSQARLLSESVPYAHLPELYRSALVLLNDHWPDMRKHGFLSNRLFDAAACGANIISDDVDGIGDIFGDLILTYKTRSELAHRLQQARTQRKARSAEQHALAAHIRQKHSFEARATEILHQIDTLDTKRRLGL